MIWRRIVFSAVSTVIRNAEVGVYRLVLLRSKQNISQKKKRRLDIFATDNNVGAKKRQKG
jgi:hypothetical protein